MKRRKRKLRPNLWIRKGRPKFIVSLPDGDQVWKYRGHEIVIGKTKKNKLGTADVYYSTDDFEFIAGSTPQDALGRAKRTIDRHDYLNSLDPTKRWELDDLIGYMWEAKKTDFDGMKGTVTRAKLSRSFEKRRGTGTSTALGRPFETFDRMSLADRLSLLDALVDEMNAAARFNTMVAKLKKNPMAERKNPGKYRVEKRGKWRIYWSQDKRIRLHEGKRQVKVKRAFGRYKGLKTERYWNVFVDGKLIGSRGLLRAAKELAEAKLSGGDLGVGHTSGLGPTRKRGNPKKNPRPQIARQRQIAAAFLRTV